MTPTSLSRRTCSGYENDSGINPCAQCERRERRSCLKETPGWNVCTKLCWECENETCPRAGKPTQCDLPSPYQLKLDPAVFTDIPEFDDFWKFWEGHRHKCSGCGGTLDQLCMYPVKNARVPGQVVRIHNAATAFDLACSACGRRWLAPDFVEEVTATSAKKDFTKKGRE